MNPFVIETAKRFDTYRGFRDRLISKGDIESTTTHIKENGFKGLKEFYKSVHKG